MDCAGEHAFAGAAFAAKEHGGIAGGDLAREAENALHQRAGALKLGRTLWPIDDALQPGDFLLEYAELKHTLADQPHLCGGEGFGEIVERAEFHRLDGIVDRAMGGDHDHLDPGALCHQPGNEIQAERGTQSQIDEGQIEGVLASLIERILGVADGNDAVPVALDAHREGLADIQLVVNDQNI